MCTANLNKHLLILIMFRVLQVVNRFATAKPSLGFQALRSKQIRQQVQKHGNQKLDALVEVVLSLNNRETEYLNLLMSQNALEAGQSILTNKIVNINGYRLKPIQYFYQQEWIKQEWKDTELLQFIQSEELEEGGQEEEVEAVKENYDVELTSLDQAQKIKIIKSLRQIFNLGLKEAKDFADKVPSMLKKNMKREEAEKLKKDL